jgi:hypothetical protein
MSVRQSPRERVRRPAARPVRLRDHRLSLSSSHSEMERSATPTGEEPKGVHGPYCREDVLFAGRPASYKNLIGSAYYFDGVDFWFFSSHGPSAVDVTGAPTVGWWHFPACGCRLCRGPRTGLPQQERPDLEAATP